MKACVKDLRNMFRFFKKISSSMDDIGSTPFTMFAVNVPCGADEAAETIASMASSEGVPNIVAEATELFEKEYGKGYVWIEKTKNAARNGYPFLIVIKNPEYVADEEDMVALKKFLSTGKFDGIDVGLSPLIVSIVSEASTAELSNDYGFGFDFFTLGTKITDENVAEV